MNDEEKAKAEAEVKAKKDEAEAKAKATREHQEALDAEDEFDEDDEDEEDDDGEELEKIRRKRKKARREKKFLDEMFAPVKELLDEWSEYKNENNWSPKSKRTVETPIIAAESSPPEKEKKIALVDSVFGGFSGKGGMWDL